MTPKSGADSPPPLRNILLSGSAWMVGLRWSLRFLGAINIAILARLLTPADFGVVAMATAVVALSKVFFEFGVDYALIRKNDATEDHFHAAWSIRLLQSIALAVVLVIAAPFAAAHFEDARVPALLWVLAGGIIIQGFTNIGVISFRKDLEFNKEFKFLTLSKIISIGFTITVAFVLRSYWALIIGIVAANAIECLLSYRLHPFRPKFSLSCAADIWSFSKWMMVLNIANYLGSKFDRLLLGGLVSPANLGKYTLGVELATMAATELSAPVSRAILPGLAKLQVDPKRLRSAFLKTLGATAIVTAPTSIGLALVAQEAVPIFLGSQWLDAIPIVQIASVQLMFATLGSAASNICLITGYIRALVVFSVLRAVVFLLCFYAAFGWGGILGILYLRLALAFVSSSFLLILVARTHSIKLSAILRPIWRPLVGISMMAVVIGLLTSFFGTDPATILITKIIVGCATYVTVTLGLWAIFGTREDIEAELIRLITRRFSH